VPNIFGQGCNIKCLCIRRKLRNKFIKLTINLLIAQELMIKKHTNFSFHWHTKQITNWWQVVSIKYIFRVGFYISAS